jgi:hypothetical protein
MIAAGDDAGMADLLRSGNTEVVDMALEPLTAIEYPKECERLDWAAMRSAPVHCYVP